MKEIALLLDKSGSMLSLQKTTVKAVNNFICEQKSIHPKQRLSLIQFNEKQSWTRQSKAAQQKPTQIKARATNETQSKRHQTIYKKGKATRSNSNHTTLEQHKSSHLETPDKAAQRSLKQSI